MSLLLLPDTTDDAGPGSDTQHKQAKSCGHAVPRFDVSYATRDQVQSEPGPPSFAACWYKLAPFQHSSTPHLPQSSQHWFVITLSKQQQHMTKYSSLMGLILERSSGLQDSGPGGVQRARRGDPGGAVQAGCPSCT